jgi:hypothetical protein
MSQDLHQRHLQDLTVDDHTDLLAVAQDWLQLFANRTQPYALQQSDGSYRWIYEDCTPRLVAAHLAGELTLALSSTSAHTCSRWACLDVDVPGSLPQLVALRVALAELGLPGLVEASRRGGHLWLFCEELVPAVALRFALARALAEALAMGVEVPAHELYPDALGTGRLGHAVRLPLGVHRRTGLRYPLFDEHGLPCAFTTTEKAVTFVLGAPRIAAGPLRERWQLMRADRKAVRTSARAAHSERNGHEKATEQSGADHAPRPPSGPQMGNVGAVEAVETVGTVGTRSAVIRWVDAHVSPLELLADLAPESELRRAGRGSIGWCPFHDDRAPDAVSGERGMPSFYVVEDRRYGWSWRCLSTNCAQNAGPMRHSFRLLQELLGVSVAAAIREAVSRWPAADARVKGPAASGVGLMARVEQRKEIADGDGGRARG